MMRLMTTIAMLGIAPLVWADSISYSGKTVNNVYVRQSDTLYYVQNPQDGTVVSVPKSDVQQVTLSEGMNRRKLLEQWNSANASLRGAPVSAPVAAEAEASAPKAETKAVPREIRASGSGPISIKMKNVPLKDALKATLRTQGLDYSVEDNYVRVATPGKLRQEPFEGVQTQAYVLNNDGATLPKVVVKNPAGGAMAQTMYGGGGTYGGRMNQGAFSGGGFGGGGSMMGGGFNGGGMMGGGYGGGMMGGYGGYMGGGQTFSNISDLFSTIDDRLVGETPAIIGYGGLNPGPLR